MHPEMPQLYALHEVDARILHLERMFRNLDNGDRARAALETARQELAQRQDVLKRARVQQAETESALKANETKYAQLNKRLYGGTVANAREAEAVEHEMAALKAAAGDLETGILEAMDAIESGETAVQEQTAVVEASERTLNETLATHQKQVAAIQREAGLAKRDREAALKNVSAALLAHYDSARRRTRDTGLSVVEGQSCGACRMQVPGMSILQLNNEQQLVTCDNCGRLLYRKS